MENSQLPRVGRYDFQIEPFHCDFTNRLFPGHLGNGMLNAADYHSTERGYGVAELNVSHKTWVLSRFAIEILEMPFAYDKVAVKTWVEAAKKFFTSRNFAVTSPDGQKAFAYGKSIWAMIDTNTRQPTDILSIKNGIILNYIESEESCPIVAPSRVVIGHDMPFARKVDTHYNDVDINGHVNSVRYIDHILDLFSLVYYKTHQLRRIDIAYIAEAHAGDQLLLFKEEVEADEFVVRIVREEDKEIEIVRCKVKFVKD